MLHKRLSFLALFLLGSAALAQTDGAGGQAVVALQENPAVGAYLADGEGRTLYLFTRDEAGSSSCDEACAENWPPLITEGRPVARGGVVPGFLGTIERSDGSQQVTYRGLPLYYFAGDEGAESFAGQGRNDVWYMVSQTGDPITGTPEVVAASSETGEASDEQEPQAPVDLALLQAGEGVYSSFCVACHGVNGEGGQGVSLAGNENLADTRYVVRQILLGGDDMPGFANVLSDDQVANVATYIRNSWGNSFGLVTPEEVTDLR